MKISKRIFSILWKFLWFGVSHDLLRSKIKITLFLTPNYDVIMGFCFGQWRHQSKDHQKLIQHAKFQKIRRSRFCGPQFSPNSCSNRFSAPLQNQYTHAPRTNVYEIFILNFISFNSRQKISFPQRRPCALRRCPKYNSIAWCCCSNIMRFILQWELVMIGSLFVNEHLYSS